MLSKEAVSGYQAIYKKVYGKEISYEQALEQGIKLIRLVELIYQPITENEYQELQERRRETGDLLTKN